MWFPLCHRPVRYLFPSLVWVFILSGCGNEPPPPPSESFESALADSPREHARKHLDPKYVCPMHPQIVRDEPGSCPICGMDLVVKQLEASKDKHPVVEVSHQMVQNLGVRTERAKIDTLWKFIRTVGRVDYDETRLVHIHPRAEGWLETLKVRAEGDPVKAGQLLGELYSPEILGAQVDFLVALDRRGGAGNIDKARNRLRLLGLAESTINQIQERGETRNRIPLFAPEGGIMVKLLAREGMYVKPEMEIFTLVDATRMWVLVDVYEHQIAWLREGLTAEIAVPAYPGRKWEGRVEYIYPELDPRSRTLKVRLGFDNPDGQLKASMFAEATIYGGPKRNTLMIPSQALIVTGERNSVIKALGGGRFQPVDVSPGSARAGWVEILDGLEEGDEVVVSGQFLLDSESSLQASFLRMEE